MGTDSLMRGVVGFYDPPPAGTLYAPGHYAALEERPDGLYDLRERPAGPEVDGLVSRLRAVPDVRLAPHADGPRVKALIEDLLRARATLEA